MAAEFSLVINHIALSVPDVEAAVKWYKDVFGFAELRPSKVVDRAETPDAGIFTIYPKDLNRVRVGYMSAGNGIGIELFEFQDPKIAEGCEANFERDYKRGGLFHFAVTTPDVEALCVKVEQHGGQRIGAQVPVYQHRAGYVQDPWGNVIELLTASFERVMSNR